MTTVSGTNGSTATSGSSGSGNAQASTEFKAEVAKVETPKAQATAEAPKEQPKAEGSGNLVAPKEAPKADAPPAKEQSQAAAPKTETKTEAPAAKPEATKEQPKAEQPKGEAKTGAAAQGSKAEGAKEQPKAEPSHQSTVNSHSSQLGSMQSAIADAEADRGSQTMGMQAINNGLSFVNGERKNWEQANSKVGEYERKLNAFAAGAKDAPSADELKAARQDAEQAVQSYTGQSAANDAASGQAVASTLVRGQGVLKATGGALQTAAGVGMLAAPEPTMLTKVGGSLAVAKGADDIQSGLRQALTGEETSTLTHDASAAAARGLGADEATARTVGGTVDFAAGVGVPTGLAQRVGANMDEGMRFLPAAAKAGADAVGDGINSVKNAVGNRINAVKDHIYMNQPSELNPDGLFGQGERVSRQLPGLYKADLPNGTKVLVDKDFQNTDLSDPHYFNDIRDVIEAVDQAGGAATDVTTKSGKLIHGEGLGEGVESVAYKVGDRVVKVKRPDAEFYDGPTRKMTATEGLRNAPEAARWKEEAGLDIGQTLFAMQGPPNSKFATDMTIQPFYEAQVHQPLKNYTDGQQIGSEINQVLQRQGFPDLRVDRMGPNIATNADPNTLDITNTFFDPIVNPRRASDTTSAWRRWAVYDPNTAQPLAPIFSNAPNPGTTAPPGTTLPPTAPPFSLGDGTTGGSAP